MVVGNLNIEGVSIVPAEANAVLIVDADAVLPLAAAFQGFELVAGNRRQIAQCDSPIQMDKLSDRSPFDGLKLLGELLLEDLLGFGVSKTANHIADCISISDTRSSGGSMLDRGNERGVVRTQSERWPHSDPIPGGVRVRVSGGSRDAGHRRRNPRASAVTA